MQGQGYLIIPETEIQLIHRTLWVRISQEIVHLHTTEQEHRNMREQGCRHILEIDHPTMQGTL